MTFDYKYITIGEIDYYYYHDFICDGDKKKIIVEVKKGK